MAEKNKYLSQLELWSPEQAERIAIVEGMILHQGHLDVLVVARNFYAEFGFSPTMRPLCKAIAENLSLDKGRGVYLNRLFPGSSAKLVAKLAGLPKPKSCL
jgi:tRNA 2-thiouridine synthesizing protein E